MDGPGDLLGSILSGRVQAAPGSEKENHPRDGDSASSLTPTAAHGASSRLLCAKGRDRKRSSLQLHISAATALHAMVGPGAGMHSLMPRMAPPHIH
jgi:hypothetical protein